jgi:predicted O-methyltransferase YrrM
LARAAQAQNILELGTATGYSTIYLGRACQPGGRVVTLERDESFGRLARGNFAKAGLEKIIEVKVGDALKIMATMPGGVFDFIFLDIDKESYLPALPHCHRLLRTEGLLVADNTGFAGAADFNREIFGDSRWRTVHLLSFLPRHSPERDGISLAVKVGE